MNLRLYFVASFMTISDSILAAHSRYALSEESEDVPDKYLLFIFAHKLLFLSLK